MIRLFIRGMYGVMFLKKRDMPIKDIENHKIHLLSKGKEIKFQTNLIIFAMQFIERLINMTIQN